MLCALVAPVHAQKTKAQINSEILTNLPDNTAGQITPQGLRAVAADTVNSIMPTAPVVSGNLASFNGTTGLLQDSIVLSAPTLNGIQFIGIGNNVADAIARWGGTKMPLVTAARIVDWAGINDHTYDDWSVITPVDNTSGYASYATDMRTSGTASIQHLVAYEDIMHPAASGTLGEQWSFLSLPNIDSPTTTRRGFYAGEPQGAGTIGTSIGVSVAAMTRGTTNWAVKTEGITQSSFGGVVFGNAVGSGSISAFVATSANPSFGLNFPSAGANQKNWDITSNATNLLFRAVSDDNLSATNWLSITRGAGTAVGAITFGGALTSTTAGTGSAAPFVAGGTTPTYGWNLTTNGVDQKNWDITENATSLLFRAVNDANSSAVNWMTVTRGTGTAISSVSIPSLALTSGNFFVGNASNNAVSVAMSGDATLANTGAVTVTKTNGTSFGALATATPGTGVATALGVNVGTAGSPVVNGGVLGTPSSGTATNLTGVASGLTAGTVVTVDDTTTNSVMFPTWVSGAGNVAEKTSSTKLSFNPSTGILFATTFSGAGTNLTGTGASFTAGNVTTNANLTGDVTSVGNATTFTGKVGGVLGQIPAANSNSNASAGNIGEFISSAIPSGSSVSLTNNTTANVTSISLTAGDWDVSGQVAFFCNAATTSSAHIGAISTVSATLPTPGTLAGQAYAQSAVNYTAGTTPIFATGTTRISLNATTTVYLLGFSTFAVNTMNVYGVITARRAR